MDQADEIVGQHDAVRMAGTQLHVINGKTTVWEPIEVPKDEYDEETEGECYIKRGNATASESFKAPRHCVMVAYIVENPAKNPIEGLQNAKTMTWLELNPVALAMSAEELKEALDNVKELPPPLKGAALAAYAKNIANRGKELHTPDDGTLLRGCHRLFAQYPKYISQETGAPSKRQLSNIHRRLLIENEWSVGRKRLENLFYDEFRVLSVGFLPATNAQLLEEQCRLDDEAKLYKLPTQKEKKVPVEKEPLTELEKATKRSDKNKLDRLIHRRGVQPKSVHDLIAQDVSLKQREETEVQAVFRMDQNLKSNIQIVHRFLYQDSSCPDQPKIRSDVELTFRNARPRFDRTPTDDRMADEYTPSHRFFDVSEPAHLPFLQKLFSHATRQQGDDYFDNLYKTIRITKEPLTLVIFNHNEDPCTSNLFTSLPNMPADHSDLRIMMRLCPTIAMLVCGDIRQEVNDVVRSWKAQAQYDPIYDFFVDPSQAFVNDKGIKPTPELPKFMTQPRYSFEDLTEYTRQTGIGALLEQRFSMGDHQYSGTAALVPLPKTVNRSLNIPMAYHMQFSQQYKRDAGSLPSLTENDSVKVDLSPSPDVTSEHTWQGMVTAPSDATNINHINIITQRPTDTETGQPLDLTDYSTLKHTQLALMDADSLKAWTRSNCDTEVEVLTSNPQDECKRLMFNVDALQLPRTLQEQFPIKHKALQIIQQFLMCKDHERTPRLPLYERIHPSGLVRALNVVRNALRPYQLEHLDRWLQDGVPARTAVITGPSGSGKSYLGLMMTMPYLLPIEIKEEEASEIAKEQGLFFQSKEEKDQIKEEKKIAREKKIAGTDTDTDADVDTNAPVTTEKTACTGTDTDANIDTNTPVTTEKTACIPPYLRPKANAPATTEKTACTGTDTDANVDTNAPITTEKTASIPPHLRPKVNDPPHTTTSPKADDPPHIPKPARKKMNDKFFEHGRVTACAAQNDTVDDLYRKGSSMVDSFTTAMNMPPCLMIRLHRPDSEVKATIAMIRPGFTPEQDPSTSFILDSQQELDAKDRLSNSLLNHYLRAYRGRGTKDRRIREIEGSLAFYTLQLTRFNVPDSTPDHMAYSASIRNKFTPAELKYWHEELKGLRTTHLKLKANGNDLDKDIENELKKVIVKAQRELTYRASVIFTTFSVAAKKPFTIIRQSHCTFTDEFGRANDAEAAGLFSLDPTCTRVNSGDPRHINPYTFGNALDNTFQKQTATSLLTRLVATGADVASLKYTSRFSNSELLNLCAMVNRMPELQAVEGAFNTQRTGRILRQNEAIWNAAGAVLILNPGDCDVQGRQSIYCLQTAVVTMHDVIERCRQMNGSFITIITPYLAQLFILRQMIEYATAKADRNRDTTLARSLSHVVTSTCDSYIGKENAYVILDTAGNPKGHLMEMGRFIVSFTRSRDGFTVVAPTKAFTSPLNSIGAKHPVREFINASKKIRTISTTEYRSFEQFAAVRELVKPGDFVEELAPINPSRTLIAAGSRDRSDDDDEENYFTEEEMELRKLINDSITAVTTDETNWGTDAANNFTQGSEPDHDNVTQANDTWDTNDNDFTPADASDSWTKLGPATTNQAANDVQSAIMNSFSQQPTPSPHKPTRQNSSTERNIEQAKMNTVIEEDDTDERSSMESNSTEDDDPEVQYDTA
ncbi:hypothetical protein GQ44DRAFT_731236 [Phaeosphaeriaceae sp. PMI808]|nr:hypothetical protein GQ44DRAFT_731236 [Phaeosphaeriaceae sp. PMI808]